MIPAQTGGDLIATIGSSVLTAAGLIVLAGLLATGLGILHRWYARAPVPSGLTVLVGLTGVVLILNVDSALGSLITSAIGGDPTTGQVFTRGAVVLNTLTLAFGSVTAAAGGRLGDRIGESVLSLKSGERVGVDVSTVVEAVGRVITVELPSEIEDMSGYDPVTQSVKDSIAGTTLVFPRRLTANELHDRLVARLRSDYGVGHVDVTIEDGTVTYLALGSRESGLGPTIPPETCAVAIRADPAFAASAGDLVQVYRPADGAPERVATGELRAAVDDIVTLAVDASDADRLDSETRYRLATLPVEPRADREFASLLRAADETMRVITVTEASQLIGSPVGAIAASVVAVQGAEGLVPIPSRTQRLEAGDILYAIATPSKLRRLDEAAAPAEADSD